MTRFCETELYQGIRHKTDSIGPLDTGHPGLRLKRRFPDVCPFFSSGYYQFLCHMFADFEQ